MVDPTIRMTRRTLLKLFTVAGIGGAGLVGSMASGPSNSAGRTTPSGEPIKIGMIDPITGPYSTSSMHDIHGATVAMDMANRTGGVLGRPVELLEADDASDPETARAQALTLIKQHRVHALMGTFNGDVALAVSEIAEKEGVLFMVTSAHIDELSSAACRPSTFVFMPSARMLAQTVAPRIAKEYGSRWFFITADTMDGASAYGAMSRALHQLGGMDAGRLLIPFGEKNFTAALQEAKEAKPDAVILNVYGWDLVHALRTAGEMNIAAETGIGGLIAGEQIGRPLGYAANRGIWGLVWDPKVPTEGSRRFIDGVVAKYRHTPTSRCYLGYGAMTQVLNAMRRAGTTEVSALIKALEGREFDGLKEGPSFFRAWDHLHVQDVLVGRAFGKELGLGHYDIISRIPGDAVAVPRELSDCRI